MNVSGPFFVFFGRLMRRHFHLMQRDFRSWQQQNTNGLPLTGNSIAELLIRTIDVELRRGWLFLATFNYNGWVASHDLNIVDKREWCASPTRKTVIRTLRRLHLNWTATATIEHQWKIHAARPIGRLYERMLCTHTERECACVRGIATIASPCTGSITSSAYAWA